MSRAKIVELTEDNTCKICENALGRYCCPRCNILYCTLTCYQSEKHLQCSENFYRECVMENLSSDDSDEKMKSMMEILKRTHESNGIFSEADEVGDIDSDDDENYADIAERLAGVNLDNADEVWQNLTDDERQEFVAFLKSEDVTKLIPKWEPWWDYHNSQKVKEVGECEKYREKCPKIKEDIIKDFNSMSSKEPSDCVQYNLINLLAAYTFTTRYFNGDYRDFVKEAVSCIASLSLCLKSNQNFADFETCVKSVEQECFSTEWILADSENISTMREDLHKILQGPEKENRKFYILAALSDLHDLLQESLQDDNKAEEKTSFTKNFPNPHFPSVALENKNKIKAYVKKVEYFLSYTRDRLQL